MQEGREHGGFGTGKGFLKGQRRVLSERAGRGSQSHEGEEEGDGFGGERRAPT